MAQETNLNVSPYFDDFDENKQYHKVLFKPGYPVQARELTTIQSILQNQIENFGNHVFKEGSRVLSGETHYNQYYSAVELNRTYIGLDVSSYVKDLIGLKVRGERTNVTALVTNAITSEESERNNPTIYVSYLNVSPNDNETFKFEDGENLIVQDTLITENYSFIQGETVASCIGLNCNSFGSSFEVESGIYYLRGFFIKVNKQLIILDQYTNVPDYKIGFYIDEEIINSNIDESLTDNAKGFNNYAAPGADRLKLTPRLVKKDFNDNSSQNFIEIAQVQLGVLKAPLNDPIYNLINDRLAKRTFDESGNYYVDRFIVTCEESLNDRVGNNGIFSEDQKTYQGNIPSEDLAIYKVSPGKAYVEGYDVQITSPTFLDVDKTRTTKTTDPQSIVYYTGPSLTLNRVRGCPSIGVGNTYIVSLRDSRIGIDNSLPSGQEIGIARVFDFALEEGTYSGTTLDANKWDISLFDVQTYTKVTLNQPITLSASTYVIGNSSGAIGYVKDDVNNSQNITLYGTNGTFLRTESFTFGSSRSNRMGIAVTTYGLSDVRSIFSNENAIIFNADTIQSNNYSIGICTVSADVLNSSIITIPGISYVDNLKIGDLLSFTDPTNMSLKTYCKISSISDDDLSTFLTVSGVTTVSNVCQGKLPSTIVTVSDLNVLKTLVPSNLDTTLYTPLPKRNVSNVDLSNSQLIVKKQYNVQIANNATNILTSDQNYFFLPYDEEKYTLVTSSGVIEELSSDKVQVSLDGSSLQIRGLSTATDSNAILTTTLRKISVTSKTKRKTRVSSIIVDKSTLPISGIGTSTKDDGLAYGNYPYGTRVQDEEISLNVPDIFFVHGIYESYDISNPSAPILSLTSIVSANSNLELDSIIGERIIGKTSNSVAICAEKINSNEIVVIPKNNNTFQVDEIVEFEESGITAIVVGYKDTSKNISNNYTYDNGQRETFYDYGRIVRNSDTLPPQRKIKIYFDYAYHPQDDSGDITTANSYKLMNYTKDYSYHKNYKNTDILDIRPRVSRYIVSENSRSPFEFLGRTFLQSEGSSPHILSPDESIVVSYDFYLPRIDTIYLTKDRRFILQKGVPDENPKSPLEPVEGIQIARIFMPPYLYDTRKCSISFNDYKRYQMKDIAKLEDRIKNLEYYSTLSLLETDTANMFIPDSSGLNRYKSGFFVDNFRTLLNQDIRFGLRNSIDKVKGILRPSHYTTSIDLRIASKVGLTNSTNLNEDVYNLTTDEIAGSNIKKTGEIISLHYNDSVYINQPKASQVINIQPYIVDYWSGDLRVCPESDTWVDTVEAEPLRITEEGDYLSVLNQYGNPQNGLYYGEWGAPELVGYGSPEWVDARNDKQGGNSESSSIRNEFASTVGFDKSTRWRSHKEFGFDVGAVPTRGLYVEKRTATYTKSREVLEITETFTDVNRGRRKIKEESLPYIRSRNIEFKGKKFKPFCKLYAFFDGRPVTDFCFPKLIRIEIESGEKFEVGETVEVKKGNSDDKVVCTFRVAKLNHKSGSYNSPSKIYNKNPYNPDELVQENYSSSTTMINIDTSSLALKNESDYYGLIRENFKIIGRNSKCVARVTSKDIVCDEDGDVVGSLFVPDPYSGDVKFQKGTRVFKLTSDPNNSNIIKGSSGCSAEAPFTAEGTLETYQQEIVSIRNAEVKSLPGITTSFTESEFTGLYLDPIAQSFSCDDSTGVYLTKIDVYFQSKDTNNPVTCEIRSMDLGLPTSNVLPFSKVTLSPSEVNISDDASIPTTFVFDSPVYLEGLKEYAIVLMANSTLYNVWISSIFNDTGDINNQPQDTLTGERITVQPYLGSLFKSQNSTTWSPSQYEDLKFTLYRAEFSTNPGTLNLYNPSLNIGNGQIPILSSNPIDFDSRKIRISLSQELIDANFTVGSNIRQISSNATGIYIDKVGSLSGSTSTGELQIDNIGIGYTPFTGTFTYTDVPLRTVIGDGTGATSNIEVTDGSVSAVTIVNGGYGYSIGDLLTAEKIGTESLGLNLQLAVLNISQFNEIIVNNVQGEFNTGVGVGNTIQYQNANGDWVNLNNSDVTPLSPIKVESDGLNFRVKHVNHGMHSKLNYVKLYGISPDVPSTNTTISIDNTFTGSIGVGNSSLFETFEGLPVNSLNPGYAIIGTEIVKYLTGPVGMINIISRGINNTIPISYPANSTITKYEINGVSLLRLNKLHRIEDTLLDNPIGLDYYSLRIDPSGFADSQNNLVVTDRSSTGTLKPLLYFNDDKFGGGSGVRATQNIQYEIITPEIESFIPSGTDIVSQMRTISGTSVSGIEKSFIDQGYERVSLGKRNYFETPRIICSQENESKMLDDLPGNKSLNVLLTFLTSDSRLSPIIDLNRMSVITTSNRVNKIVPDSDYPTDNRVNSLTRDQNACIYVTNQITLENPATSLKVYLSADIDIFSDIRVLYSISNSEDLTPVFNLFPGYAKINNPRVNTLDDGTPDVSYVKHNMSDFISDNFIDHVFTVDNLPEFKNYRIKIILTSTRQSYVPLVRDLRAIALA